MYKIMPSLSNPTFLTLVIGILSIGAIPAQASPQNNSHSSISTTGDRTSQLVAGNNQGVRRYSRDRIALETEISTRSGTAENSLAQYLAKRGVKFYGAYWCPHCQHQKELFGKEAVNYLPYVECARDAQNSQAQLCKEKKVELFPSWEINGKIIPGSKSLKELAKITGYQGPKNFINK
jgi:glutaredoxin